MNEYEIHPNIKINGPFTYKYDSKTDAITAAINMAKEHRCNVDVLMVLGTASIDPKWEEKE